LAANSRFAVAVHTMAMLACASEAEGDATAPGGFVTSEAIAESVCTNPVVIRRILSALHAAKLVDCQPGKSGGSRLARKSQKITLLDIYRAVQGESLFGMPEKPANKSCAVSCGMKSLLSDVFAGAERAVESSLRDITLAKLVRPLD